MFNENMREFPPLKLVLVKIYETLDCPEIMNQI